MSASISADADANADIFIYADYLRDWAMWQTMKARYDNVTLTFVRVQWAHILCGALLHLTLNDQRSPKREGAQRNGDIITALERVLVKTLPA